MGTAKGGAILLVVLGHVWRNAHADRMIASETFVTVDRAIYLFHMPAFFLLSGLFLPCVLARKGFATFLRSRPSAILVPLFFWAYVQALLRFATEGWASLGQLAATPFRADTIFWFLWVLLACQIVTAVLTRFKAKATLAWATAALCVIGVLLLPRDYGSLGYRFVEMFPFYAAGTQIPGARWQHCRAGALIGATVFISAQIVAALLTSTTLALHPCSIVATAGFLLFCASISGHRTAPARGLAFLGRWSMAIYLLHVPFLAVHIFLTKWGLTEPALQLTLATALGVGGSLTGGAMLIRLGFSMLLGQRPINSLAGEGAPG